MKKSHRRATIVVKKTIKVFQDVSEKNAKLRLRSASVEGGVSRKKHSLAKLLRMKRRPFDGGQIFSANVSSLLGEFCAV